MSLNFESITAKLTHINVRKQGPEEESVTAIDLKIECETTGAVLSAILGTEEAPNFWMDNEDKDILYSGLSECTTWGTFDGRELKIAGLHFKSADLKKFKFKPIAGQQVDLTFSASILNPTDREINILVEVLHDESPLKVISKPDLFDQDAA